VKLANVRSALAADRMMKAHQDVERGIAGEAQDVVVPLSSAQSIASTRP
jgi:hypothetical protein